MKERGIRKTPSGWQVYARVRGEFRSKHFAPETDLATLKGARDDLRLHAIPRDEHRSGTIAADVAAYLDARQAMRSIADRTHHLEEWRDALGAHKSRLDVTPFDVRRVLEQWAREKKLKPASLNRRRTALMSFYTVIDPDGYNPARRVARWREHVEPFRLPNRSDVLTVIANIGVDKNRKDRGEVLKGAKTRARLSVLAWTAWPAAQLMRLKRTDVNFRARTALIRGRQKGAGTRDTILPLLPQAVAALREMKRLDAWGPFSTSAMHSSVARTCKKLGLTPWHPYALRHLLLSEIAALARDDRAVAELGMHTSPAQTRRYTESTVPRRLTDALKAVAEKLQSR